jgi:hypothetical protein
VTRATCTVTFTVPEPDPEPVPAIRYTPGHYVSLQRAQDSQALMGQCLTSAPTLKGFVKRWTWLSFESSLDNYLMATHELNSDLAWCQARGLKMIVMIEHRTFGYADNTPNPPYLNGYTAETPAQGDQPAPGYTIAIWDPFVVTRLKLLLTRFAAHFGGHPALEGVMIEETSLGIPSSYLTTPPTGKLWVPYTAEMYRDALIAIMAHWGTVQPDARWFFYLNFMAGNTSGTYLNQAVLASDNCVVCGPDCQPNEATLEARTYWIYRDNKDVRPVACFASTRVYNSGATGDEIWTLATDLGVDYMMWVCQGVSTSAWLNVARPQIIGHPAPFSAEDWS